MANITRFDPSSSISRFESLPLVSDLLSWFGMRPFSFQRDFEFEPDMKMDVAEVDGAFVVKAEIPGVDKNDIHVSIDGSRISISAEVKKEKEEREAGRLLRNERYFGRVSRSFSLDSEVDAEKTKARYADGVLELTLPRKSGEGKKAITVS
jgi:HSP20 family protein